MKKLLPLIIIAISIFTTYAQDYQINFTASGQSTSIDNIVVQNLTQNTELTLNGTDVLHLVQTLNINDITDDGKLSIFPNPMQDQMTIQLFNETNSKVAIQIIDITGKTVLKTQENLPQGTSLFAVQGLKQGMYLVNITTNEKSYTKKVIATATGTSPSISYIKTNNNSLFRNVNSLVEMQYNTGDLIQLKATSGNNSRVVTLTPTNNTSVDFNFIDATDIDGNHYTVVTIGTQTWMVENLRVTHYPNGDAIPLITTDSAWAQLDDNNTDDAYCFRSNQPIETYGASYSYAAAIADDWTKDNTAGQGVCPDGWHIPTHAEWTTLADFVTTTHTGSKLAGRGTLWQDGYLEQNSDFGKTGFNAVPAGKRKFNVGTFVSLGSATYFWTADTRYSGTSRYRSISYSSSSMDPYYDEWRSYGFSVRCLRN